MRDNNNSKKHNPMVVKNQGILPSPTYINQFLKLHCSSDLLNLGIFDTATQITTAIAAWKAFFICLDGRNNIKCNLPTKIICIDNDNKPRIGTFCSFMSPFSIDHVSPAISNKTIRYFKYSVNNLSVYNEVEAYIDGFVLDAPSVLILQTPSHALLKKIRTSQFIDTRTIIIHHPLSKKDGGERLEDISMSYEDIGIWSENNVVSMYW